jgi:hypothetical protein
MAGVGEVSVRAAELSRGLCLLEEAGALCAEAVKLRAAGAEALLTRVQAERAAGRAATHYAVLGVGAEATEEEISRAYKVQSLKLHPDRHQSKDDKFVAESRFKRLGKAKWVLSDAQRRSAYDRALVWRPRGKRKKRRRKEERRRRKKRRRKEEEKGGKINQSINQFNQSIHQSIYRFCRPSHPHPRHLRFVPSTFYFIFFFFLYLFFFLCNSKASGRDPEAAEEEEEEDGGEHFHFYGHPFFPFGFPMGGAFHSFFMPPPWGDYDDDGDYYYEDDYYNDEEEEDEEEEEDYYRSRQPPAAAARRAASSSSSGASGASGASGSRAGQHSSGASTAGSKKPPPPPSCVEERRQKEGQKEKVEQNTFINFIDRKSIVIHQKKNIHQFY